MIKKIVFLFVCFWTTTSCQVSQPVQTPALEYKIPEWGCPDFTIIMGENDTPRELEGNEIPIDVRLKRSIVSENESIVVVDGKTQKVIPRTTGITKLKFTIGDEKNPLGTCEVPIKIVPPPPKIIDVSVKVAPFVVKLAADNPPSMTLLAGRTIAAPMLMLTLNTYGKEDVTFNSIGLERLGIASDVNISNAFLYKNVILADEKQETKNMEVIKEINGKKYVATLAAEMSSIFKGSLTFTNDSGLLTIKPGVTTTLLIEVKPSSATIPGMTIGLGLDSFSIIGPSGLTEIYSGVSSIQGNVMAFAKW